MVACAVIFPNSCSVRADEQLESPGQFQIRWKQSLKVKHCWLYLLTFLIFSTPTFLWMEDWREGCNLEEDCSWEKMVYAMLGLPVTYRCQIRNASLTPSHGDHGPSAWWSLCVWNEHSLSSHSGLWLISFCCSQDPQEPWLPQWDSLTTKLTEI